jgi:hypothetical protein
VPVEEMESDDDHYDIDMSGDTEEENEVNQ